MMQRHLVSRPDCPAASPAKSPPWHAVQRVAMERKQWPAPIGTTRSHLMTIGVTSGHYLEETGAKVLIVTGAALLVVLLNFQNSPAM